MTDYRLTPDPAKVTMQTACQIGVPVADICRAPKAPRDRQTIYGDILTVLGRDAGWCYVQLQKDGYCGHVPAAALAPPVPATHRVGVAATHAYQAADLKSPDQMSLTFGSRVQVTGAENRFARTDAGFIPLQHLWPIDTLATDPGDIAKLFLGTPYLWGGNSRCGIDCSGLVQAALLACGIDCPGDSDQQGQMVGQPLDKDTAFARHDLLFWKGHVALVLEPDLMIHANSHDMAVTLEPIAAAIQRIAATDGPLTAHRRLPPSKWS